MEYYRRHVSVMIAIFVILASSYNLVIGYGGSNTVAHPIFFALGAYTAALLAISYRSARTALRARRCRGGDRCLGASGRPLRCVFSGDYLLIASLGFQLGLAAVDHATVECTGGPGGLTEIPQHHRRCRHAARSIWRSAVPPRWPPWRSSPGSSAARTAAPSPRCATKNWRSLRSAATR